MDNITLTCKCSACGNTGTYKMNEKESKTYHEYQSKGRSMGPIQNIFPKIPAWIRSGAIDQFSGGFCLCPNCNPFV